VRDEYTLKNFHSLVLRREGVISFLFIVMFVTPLVIHTSSGQIAHTESPIAVNTYSPSLDFSTYLGDTDFEEGDGIAVGSDGSCYVTGETQSVNFPTKNAYQNIYGGGLSDAFIAKFSTNGALLWSTYLGGNAEDIGYGIAVASDDSCYIVGYTESSNFPTLNAYQTSSSAMEAFVAKFSADGVLLWSTYLGGSDYEKGQAIAINTTDSSCYVSGWTESNDFPTLDAYDDTYNGIQDAFIARFSASGSLLWSTYLGGTGGDGILGIIATSDGNCFASGWTNSIDFPTLNAYDDTYNGDDQDAFVLKFSASGSLLWSTYLGGSTTDWGTGIAVTSDGNSYVTGKTISPNFPTKNAYQNTFGGSEDAFVAKFSTIGSLLWSTYLGGNDLEYGSSIAINATDNSCFVTGLTKSKNFPTKNAYDKDLSGVQNAFVVKFFSNGTLVWSSYLGGNSWDSGTGIAIDNIDECFYVIGGTTSLNFPTKSAYQSTNSGGNDVFITKFFETTYTSEHSSAYGLLPFIIVIPIFFLSQRKRRK